MEYINNCEKYITGNLKHIYRNTFLKVENNSKSIIKFKDTSVKPFRIFKLLRANKSFNNEIDFNLAIQKHHCKILKIPKLLCYNRKKYIVFEFIESINGINLDQHHSDNLILMLLDYQTIKFKTKNSQFVLLKLINCMIYSPLTSLLRGALQNYKKSLNFKNLMHIMILSLQLLFISKPLNKKLFLHYDLGNAGNKITNSKGEIFLIDFASGRYTNKFFLVDIIDLCFDRTTLNFNRALFNDYLLKLESNLILKLNANKNFSLILRLVLLRKMLHYSLKQDTKNSKINEFIKNTLLSNYNFALFLDKVFSVEDKTV